MDIEPGDGPRPRAPRATRAMMTASSLLLFGLVACTHPRVKYLNRSGVEAVNSRNYEKAITYFKESLTIKPDQPKIRLQLDAAQELLTQIYVYKIYELVDTKRHRPVDDYLAAWGMSARLPELKVARARVASIRIDLDKRFAAAEARLRAKTEPHRYIHHLMRMVRLVPSQPVQRARVAVGRVLHRQHVDARTSADARNLTGLALLHTVAAATFAPGDTELWQQARRRRKALLDKLAIRVSVSVESASGSVHARHLLGGLARRMPRIFALTNGAPLSLSLRAGRDTPEERRVVDRLSARCQVGTRPEPNPECNSLARRAALAKQSFESQQRALDSARAYCERSTTGGTSTGQRSSSNGCLSQLSRTSSDVNRAQRRYEDYERRFGSCPPTIEKPVYRRFFYQRTTVSRSVTASARVMVSQAGRMTSRALTAVTSAQDVFGPGLSCAGIPPDPLVLSPIVTLRASAERKLLKEGLLELLTIRRKKAEAQLDGGSSDDQRLDSLVRARLVDEQYRKIATLLRQRLVRLWSTDFGLTRSVSM